MMSCLQGDTFNHFDKSPRGEVDEADQVENEAGFCCNHELAGHFFREHEGDLKDGSLPFMDCIVALGGLRRVVMRMPTYKDCAHPDYALTLNTGYYVNEMNDIAHPNSLILSSFHVLGLGLMFEHVSEHLPVRLTRDGSIRIDPDMTVDSFMSFMTGLHIFKFGTLDGRCLAFYGDAYTDRDKYITRARTSRHVYVFIETDLSQHPLCGSPSVWEEKLSITNDWEMRFDGAMSLGLLCSNMGICILEGDSSRTFQTFEDFCKHIYDAAQLISHMEKTDWFHRFRPHEVRRINSPAIKHAMYASLHAAWGFDEFTISSQTIFSHTTRITAATIDELCREWLCAHVTLPHGFELYQHHPFAPGDELRLFDAYLTLFRLLDAEGTPPSPLEFASWIERRREIPQPAPVSMLEQAPEPLQPIPPSAPLAALERGPNDPPRAATIRLLPSSSRSHPPPEWVLETPTLSMLRPGYVFTPPALNAPHADLVHMGRQLFEAIIPSDTTLCPKVQNLRRSTATSGIEPMCGQHVLDCFHLVESWESKIPPWLFGRFTRLEHSQVMQILHTHQNTFETCAISDAGMGWHMIVMLYCYYLQKNEHTDIIQTAPLSTDACALIQACSMISAPMLVSYVQWVGGLLFNDPEAEFYQDGSTARTNQTSNAFDERQCLIWSLMSLYHIRPFTTKSDRSSSDAPVTRSVFDCSTIWSRPGYFYMQHVTSDHSFFNFDRMYQARGEFFAQNQDYFVSKSDLITSMCRFDRIPIPMVSEASGLRFGWHCSSRSPDLFTAGRAAWSPLETPQLTPIYPCGGAFAIEPHNNKRPRPDDDTGSAVLL